MANINRLIIVAWLLASTVCFGAFGGVQVFQGAPEPRNFHTHCGIVMDAWPAVNARVVSNPAGLAAGSGCSALSNRVQLGTADLLQGTAANQPLLSRSDNYGNMVKESEGLNLSPWSLSGLNAFGADDSGGAGAGSFANTSRTTDPLGGNAAEFIQENNAASTTHFLFQTFGNIADRSMRMSVCAKAAGRSWMWLRLKQTGQSDSVNCWFDLAHGTNDAPTILVSGSNPAASMASLGSGWYLCGLSGKATITNGTELLLAMYAGTNNSAYIYSGDNTSGLFLWGVSVGASSWVGVTGTDASHGYISTTLVPIFPGLSGRRVLWFDGSAYYMKSGAFTLNQPTEIYSLGMPWTWTINHAMFDGNTLNSGKLYQSATSPNIRYTAGTVGTEFVPPPAGSWRSSTVVFDGANSRISTNNGAFAVSDAGAGNMGGFTLGAAGTVAGTFWNGLRAREIICNKTNDVGPGKFLRWPLLKQAELY